MTRKFYACLFMAVLAMISIAPAVAFAQEATVNVGGFYEIFRPYLIELVTVIISIIVGWVVAKIGKLTGLQIEAKHRDALQMALQNSANFSINALGAKVGTIDFKVKHELVAAALTYVQKSSPDAIAYFGLTPERLRDLIVAKLPQEYKVVTNA